jgi:hypothetical protein
MKRDSKTEDAAASVKQAKPNTKKLFLPVPTSLVSYAPTLTTLERRLRATAWL